MSIFFSDHEKQLVQDGYNASQVRKYYWATLNHASRHAANPGLIPLDGTTDWWYIVEGYLSLAAVALILKPDDKVKNWLRDTTLSVVRRPADDWIGPVFRDHDSQPPVGTEETAKIVIGVALALDMAPGIFTALEQSEIAEILISRGVGMCKRGIERSQVLSSSRAVLTSAVAVAAAVTGDKDAMRYAVNQYQVCNQALQPDGSFSESLQYANECFFSLMLTYEALVRRDSSLSEQLSLEPYIFYPRWVAHSLLYFKPQEGWDEYPRGRFANFNDCAATFRPTADLMLQISVRGREKYPLEAGLARWLFDKLYYYPNQGPFDRAGGGMANTWGFLVLPFLVQASQPVSPAHANLPTLQSFSAGDVLARDAWDGKTVLAVRGFKDSLYSSGHLHADINSFILVHHHERLLADPGHSCSRNLIHEVESSAFTHNTCTFEISSADQISQPGASFYPIAIGQNYRLARFVKEDKIQEPVDRGGRQLLAEKVDEVIAIGNEASKVYGYPIKDFSRIFLLVGSHILFIVDHILSAVPVKTTWNFVLNNRDGMLDMKQQRPENTVLARRGDAAMKLVHFSGHLLNGPYYGFIHDMEHPLPAQAGEGQSGSGIIMRWSEQTAANSRTAFHGVAMDDYGGVSGWHQRERDGWRGLESPGGVEFWGLRVMQDPFEIQLKEFSSDRWYRIGQDEKGQWELKRR